MNSGHASSYGGQNANSQSKMHFGQYYRTPSSHRKMPPQPLLYQQSPKDHRQSFEGSPFYNHQQSPPGISFASSRLSTQNAQTQRHLFPPLPPNHDTSEKNIPMGESLLEGCSSANRDKPKIVFSYSRKGSVQLGLNTLPSSCGTTKQSGLPDKVDVG